jgi:hypothetical protein
MQNTTTQYDTQQTKTRGREGAKKSGMQGDEERKVV